MAYLHVHHGNTVCMARTKPNGDYVICSSLRAEAIGPGNMSVQLTERNGNN